MNQLVYFHTIIEKIPPPNEVSKNGDKYWFNEYLIQSSPYGITGASRKFNNFVTFSYKYCFR